MNVRLRFYEYCSFSFFIFPFYFPLTTKKIKKNSSLGAIYAKGLFTHSRLRIEFVNSDSTLSLILHTALNTFYVDLF